MTEAKGEAERVAVQIANGDFGQVWMRVDGLRDQPENNPWTGTPTDRLSCLQACDATAGIARDWNQQKLAKSLTALAKQEGSGLEFISPTGRDFKTTRTGAQEFAGATTLLKAA